MKSILNLDGLTIGFKHKVAENISAQLNAGSLTALMGINGAGKSCLLKTISSLLPPLAGQLRLLGKSYLDYSPVEFALNVSLVLTEKIHVDYLIVEELVALGRSPYTNWRGSLRAEDNQIITEALEQVGIPNLRSLYFSELSDGQKQKVLIARALAQRPQLLILDEPTTYLDIPSKIELVKLLRKIATQNQIAVLLSTHDLSLIESSVDQIWLLGNEGEFVSKSPTDMKSSGLLEKHFHLNQI